MIITLSLNTAIDRTLLVPGFRLGSVQRVQRVHVSAGGKGLNVARVVRQLGEPARVIGFLGGLASPFIRDECKALDIDQRWVDIAEESRTCVIIVDPQAGSQTVVNENGPTITDGEMEWLLEEIELYVAPGDLLSISGSAARGAPEDVYSRIVREASARGARVLADVGGDELRSAADAHPWALAPNVEEAAAAFDTRDDAYAIAQRLASFTEHVLLSRGPEGVLSISGDAVLEIPSPAVQTVNAVGSGDALVAGFLTGVSRGMSVTEAICLGVACGAANARRFEPGIGSVAEVEDLLKRSRPDSHL